MLTKNLGPRYFHQSGLYKIFGLTPHFYTDPDCHFDTIADDFCSKLVDISVKYQRSKIGVALKLPTLENIRNEVRPFFDDLIKNESPFWQNSVEPLVFEAWVDTHFHLFNPAYFTFGETNFITHSLRVDGPGFNCIHLPWFDIDPITEDEREFYLKTASEWTHIPAASK